MSLDVSLKSAVPVDTVCTHCNNTFQEYREYYSANITHNLNTMAKAAGIYEYLWYPDDLGITKASELIRPLTKGLADLKARPEYFKTFNSPNGWEDVLHFVSFVEKYLEKCKENPDALIEVDR